jgi:RNA polymerase sigma-70 factor (ECF subfamily)
MPSIADIDLAPGTLERARAGEIDALEAIYRSFAPGVTTLARRLLGRLTAAEDLAQDVFVDVLTKLDQYDGRGSFAGWVRSITVTRCLMQLRSPWRRGLKLVTMVGEGDSVPDGDAEQVAADGAQLGLDLERALDRLGETARLVVWLHDVEGYTHAEIGALLGGTPSLSKSQLARAHERLRELLEPSGVIQPCMPASTIC